MKEKIDVKWLNEQLKRLHDEVTILRQEQLEFRRQRDKFSEFELEHNRLFYQLPFPLVIFDSNGTLVTVNRSFLEMCNIPSEELIVNKLNILHDGSLGFVNAGDIKAAFAGESIYLPDVDINFKNFHKRYGVQRETTGTFSITMFPVYDAAGKVKQVAAVWKEADNDISDKQMPDKSISPYDNTDQKKYEIELERLNRALKTISACNSVLVHSNSENELLDKICKIIIETGGYHFSWIGLLDSAEILIPVSSYGRENGYLEIIASLFNSIKDNANPLVKIIEDKAPFVIKDIKNDPEFSPWKDEALKRDYASVVVIPLINEEKVLGILSIYSNTIDSFNQEELDLLKELSDDLSFGISSLRVREESKSAALALSESEKRYRVFFEQDLAGDYISTPDGRILDCNASFLKIFSFPNNLEAKNFDPANLHFYPETRDMFLERIKKEKKIQGLELKMKTFDGRTIYVIEDAWGTFDGNDELVEVKGYFQDITKRKLAEEELKEAKEKAEESDRLKTEFLAQMSHEIRTPVNVMLSYTSLLKEELLDKMPQEWNSAFNSVELAGRRLIRTIDLILNMSMIQTSNTGLNSSEVDLYFLLLNLVHEYQAIIEGKNIKIFLTNKVQNPVLISDEYILTHVFQNLIDNAIKFTIEGQVNIALYKNDNKKLCVDVRDTGIGISSEYLIRMFKPFSQEDTGYSRKYEGVGLGLSIVKKYLDLLGAAIKVESEKGKGSTFTIIF